MHDRSSNSWPPAVDVLVGADDSVTSPTAHESFSSRWPSLFFAVLWLTVKVINFYHLNVVFKSLISRRFRSNLLLLSIARRWLSELRHRRVGSEWCSVSQISWSSLSKRKLRNIGKVIEPAIKGFTIRGFQAEARPSVLTNLSLHMKIYVGT